MEEKATKFLVCGYGYIGKRHARLIQGHATARLAAVVDIDPARRAEAPEGAAAYADLAEALAAEQPDAVCVCTPNGLHGLHALAALDAGCHVVCEKPMALRRADCEAIVYKALQRSRHVFCVMQNRYSPPAVWLKQVLNEGRLGRVFLAQINCYWNRDDRYYKPGGWKGTRELDGGPLFTQFSHFVDMMYWLMGDITDVAARFENFNHRHNTQFEDSGLVNFRFVNGGLGMFTYSTSVWDKNLESSITIIGERGSIKVGGQYMNEITHCHIQDYEMPELPESNPPNDYGAYMGSADNHMFVFQNVVDTLAGRSVAGVNALEGLKVVDIIERIYQLRDR